MQKYKALLTLRFVSFGASRAGYSLHAQYIAVACCYFVFLSGVAVIANHRHLQTNNAKRGTGDKLARRARHVSDFTASIFSSGSPAAMQLKAAASTSNVITATTRLAITRINFPHSNEPITLYMRCHYLLSCDFRHLVYTHLTHSAKITSEYA